MRAMKISFSRDLLPVLLVHSYGVCVLPVRPIKQTKHKRPTRGIAIRTQIKYMVLPPLRRQTRCNTVPAHRLSNRCHGILSFHLRRPTCYFEFKDRNRPLIVLSIISTSAPKMSPMHTPSRPPSIVPPITLMSRERSERENPAPPPNTAQISAPPAAAQRVLDRKSTRLNSSHLGISYAV